MRLNQGIRRNRRSNELARASYFGMEEMENRVLLSSTIAQWTFIGLATGTNLSPAPQSGTGTALTVGLQSSMSNTHSPAGVYAYPNANASGTGDISDITVGSNNEAGFTPTDQSSEGVGANAWRLRGNSDGWSDNAAIGSQGVQFTASTSGFTNIQLSFDLDASSTSATDAFQVQYTTNGTSWVDAGNATGSNLTIGAVGGGPNQGHTDGMSILTNTTNTNIVNGSYFVFDNPANLDGLFWQNGITVNFAGISSVENNPNFGVRIVNAATGTSDLEVGGTQVPTAGAGNWRIDDVKITGKPAAITLQPISQAVTVGTSATFSSTASGNPTPTEQWWVNNGSGFVMDTTDAGNTTSTLTVASTTSAESGYQYEAIFTSPSGNLTSVAATLTVATSPVITSDPSSQTVEAGSTVTLVSSAVGLPTLSPQWWVNNGSGFTMMSNSTTVSGVNTPILTFSATEASTGYQYEVIYTNNSGGATSSAATVIVQGTPITQWDFAGGESASPGGDQSYGSGNSPLPTNSVNPASATDNDITVLGMNNSYDGSPALPESDIIPIASGNDPSFSEYVMRIRGGSGSGPTGTPGTPDGWSQNAPDYTQGAQFDVNTVGYSNITLNFDWTQGAIGDLQAQIFENGNYVNVGAPVQAVSGDYYGITDPTTIATGSPTYTFTADVAQTINVTSVSNFYYGQNITVGGIGAVVTGVGTGTLTVVTNAGGSASAGAAVAAVPNPTGVSVDLQGITFANNNSDLRVRLVSSYDGAGSNLVNIDDGNPAVNNGGGTHGQYASGFGLDSDIQVIDLDNYISANLNDTSTITADGHNFTLALNGHTTGTIVYSANVTTMAANIQAALQALPNVGVGNVTVASTVATNTYTPPGPITAYNGFSVIFGAGLKNTLEPTMTISDANDNVSTWQVATPSTITTLTTAPATLTANQTVILNVASTTGFTAGNPIVLGTITCLINTGGVGTSTLTVTPETSGSVVAGTQIQQEGASGFVDGGGNWEFGDITFNGDLTSGAPSIIVSPQSETVAGGFTASFTATAYSETLPTVIWQVNTGSSWTPVSGGTVTPTGGTFTAAGNYTYTSTYSFTTDANLDQSGFKYRAVFSNGAPTDTNAATLTVVAPVAPYVLIQPVATAVQEGQNTQFTSYAIGTPTPTVQWQFSTDGIHWTNFADDDVTITGSTTDTLTLAIPDNLNDNNEQIRAQFTGGSLVTNSNAVTLSVLPTAGILTDWDFNALDTNVNAAAGSADPYNNSPTPNPMGVDNSLAVNGGGVATSIGFNLAYNSSDAATSDLGAGPSGGAVTADDITNSGPAVVDNFTENTWRLRSGINTTSGGSPSNGWSNYVAEYSQGAQFSLNTTGYSNVYATIDWFSTHSGEQNAQEQYTLNGSTWINLGSELSLFAPGNDDWYGDSLLGGVVPVVFNLSGITGANNDPNLGIRLVNVYNTILSNQVSLTLNNASNFTLTFTPNTGSAQTTGTISYTANNTQMIANITSALSALTDIGTNNVSVTYNSTSASYLIQYQGTSGTALGNAIQSGGQQALNNPPASLSSSDGGDSVLQSYQYANAQANSATDPWFSTVVYNGSKGNWRIDNITFHGNVDTTTSLVNNGSSTSNASQTLSFTATVTPTTSVIPDGETVLLEDASNGDAVVGTGLTTGGVANITVAPGTLLAGTHELFAVYGGDSIFLGSQSAQQAQTVQVVFETPVVNGNIPALVGTQRSMVDSILYTFSEAVNITGPSAVTLVVHSGQTGTVPTVGLSAVNPNLDGSSSQWQVTFSGAGVVGNSIGNGVYDISINAADITSDFDPAVAAQPRSTDTFYRLFGDFLGTENVSTTDYSDFLGTFGLRSGQTGFLAAFDSDGNGRIQTADFTAFLSDFGLRYRGFTATI